MIAPWLSLRETFVRRVGNPIGSWLAGDGTETLVRWAAYAVVILLFVAIIAISVDIIFGGGIFQQGTGCDGENPYDPCPEGRNIYSGDEPYRAE
jgi:hypothetical protein